MVLVVCVCYRSDHDAVEFVETVLSNEQADTYHLLLVDNSEASTLCETLAAKGITRAAVSLLVPGKNLGYYGGAEWGLCEYLKGHEMPDWVVVCNADLTFSGENFLGNLTEQGLTHGHAIIAPAILSRFSGRDQNPYMLVRPSRLRMRFYKFVFCWYVLLVAYSLLSIVVRKGGRMLRRLSVDDDGGGHAAPEVVRTIYAPHGACIAFRRSYFDAGGTLRHGAFLFGEEIFVAETARHLHLTIAYNPRLRVIHEEHKATGVWPTKVIAAYMQESAAYCADTFFGVDKSSDDLT